MERKQEVYKVDWFSTENPNMVFSATKGSYDEAIKLQNGLSEAVVYRLVKTGESAYKWQVVPTPTGKDLVTTVKMRRKLAKKGRLINRGGISSIGMRSVPEYQKSQKARAIGLLVVPAVTIYAGTRKDLPMWLRGALITVGVCSAYVNGRNYISNARLNAPKKKKSKK